MTSPYGDGAVAVIGMACRFPGAPDLDAYWDLLLRGGTALGTLDADRLAAAGVPGPVASDPRFVPVAGAVERTEMFDAEYFGIAPAEAAAMDPQQRLFLEESVHALEHAGIACGTGARVGVFCGCQENRYAALLPESTPAESAHRAQLDNPASLPLCVSYHLDLRGPSVFVNSLCSTSLAAVHLARRALLAGDCDTALAGAVSVVLPQDHGYVAHDGGVLSPDGHCRPFDRRSAGTVPGGGVGVVVLKRLSRAVEDGDTIHAVLRGSAMNNDGSDRLSFAAPSVRGQCDVLLAASEDSGAGLGTIGYLEAHGTGTHLGDPVEIAALREARQRQGADQRPCAIGAVKSAVGHLDTAAGMAGLIKAVLAVREGVIPATAEHTELNPQVLLDGSGLYVSVKAHPWPEDQRGPRRAAVTALGVGGTNTHVVLEEAPAPQETSSAGAQGEPVVFTLSAHSESSFAALRGALAAALSGPLARAEPADVARTLATGRTARRLRRAWVARDVAGVCERLATEGEPVAADGLVLGVGPDTPGIDRPDPALVERLAPLRDALRRDRSVDEAGPHSPTDAFRQAYGLLASLADAGVRPQGLVAVGGGEYAALAFAGAVPWDVAVRCAERHAEAVRTARSGGDLSRCEVLLESIARDLATAETGPLALDVRSATLGVLLPAGERLPAEHLPRVTRAVLMGEGPQELPADCVDIGSAGADRSSWLGLVARCWERGADVSWDTLLPAARRIPLPAYPFDAVRHWAPVAGVASPVPLQPSAADAPQPGTPDPEPAAAALTLEDVLAELAEMWRGVLGVHDIEPDDSFFALGGHSLIASQVLARIRERLDVRVSLGDLLDAETLGGMARLVHQEVTAVRLYTTLTSPSGHEAQETVEL